MGHLGLEPRTIRLKAEYSTIELVTHIFTVLYNLIKNFTRNLLGKQSREKKLQRILREPIVNLTTSNYIFIVPHLLAS